MGRKIAYSTLDATGIDMINIIRANAGYEYQSLVPVVTSITDLPKVGEIILGYPALANQFVNALVNRIAGEVVKSHTFANVFGPLKKRDLGLGETIEEAFVGMAKAREFCPEKAPAREFARTLPDVRAAFHVCNVDWQYAITVQRTDLAKAFVNEQGLENMVERIINSIYRGLEYDEYLLFKYLLIKGVNSGEIYQHTIQSGLGSDATHDAAIAFRAISNKLLFLNTQYNLAGVHNNTPREDQYIFMSADFLAQFDINVLSAAFNMDKADFMGRLIIVDAFDTFDNDRFDAIRDTTGTMEEVNSTELAAMQNVKAIIADQEFFQYYRLGYQTQFDEQYVRSGQYWNYFYRHSAIASTSPFSNCVAIVAGS